jgi:ribonuclease HI
MRYSIGCIFTSGGSLLIEVYIDGACAGDGGASGIGILIKGAGDAEEYSLPVAAQNNHEAEFIAVIEALKLCLEKDYKTVSLRTDSQIVDSALNRHYVKNPMFKPYLDAFEQLEAQFHLLFIKWVPSAQNKKADQLARAAVRRKKDGD